MKDELLALRNLLYKSLDNMNEIEDSVRTVAEKISKNNYRVLSTLSEVVEKLEALEAAERRKEDDKSI